MAKKTTKKQSGTPVSQGRRGAAAPAEGALDARRFVAGTSIRRSVLTVPFDTEAQLRRKLRQLLDVLEPPATRAAEADAEVRDASARDAVQCLDVVAATEVILEALQGKPFEPQKKLEKTYLSEVERDLFRDRVATAVQSRGCTIGLGDIPNGGGTTQLAVRDAVEQSAH